MSFGGRLDHATIAAWAAVLASFEQSQQSFQAKLVRPVLMRVHLAALARHLFLKEQSHCENPVSCTMKLTLFYYDERRFSDYRS